MITSTKQSGWHETTLEHVVKTNKRQIGRTFSFQKILYLDTGSITRGKIDSLQPYDIQDAPSRAKRLVSHGDIIYSSVRPNQQHFGLIKKPQDNLVVSTGFVVITPEKDLADSKFIYYFLTQERITATLQQIAEHATSAYPSIKPENIENLQITLPPAEEQRAIGQVLSVFDDKIELLQNQNRVLEAIAQRLFHEWFIEFNFPNKESESYKKSGDMVDAETGFIPEGWEIKGLSDIADFLNGLALQKFPPEGNTEYLPVIKIREMKAGISDQTDRASKNLNGKYIVDDGDILFSWSGSLEVVIWKYGRGALNQHLFKVTSSTYPKWFFYYWTLQHLSFFRLIASSKATTMGHIQRYHLDEAKVLVPDANFLSKANAVFEPLFNKIIKNNTHITTLTAARKRLLPEMMRGDVRVKNF